MAQHLVVALLVLGCGAYALWTLAPKAARRRLAQALLQFPLPGWLQQPLNAAARQQGSCACDGCDRLVAAPVNPHHAKPGQPVQAGFQTVHFVRIKLPKKARP